MSSVVTSLPDRKERHDALLAAALQSNGGGRAWRAWKGAAARDVTALANQAARLDVLDINLEGDLHLRYRIAMPVPRWPEGETLRIADHAVFHLGYRDRWRVESPPGWEPVGVLSPHDLFHPNARPALRGALCLGHLSAGITPKELLLLGYYALSLQDLSLSEEDVAGVMNSQASDFYRSHGQYLPLTRAGLLEPWTPEGVA